jgi:hypothetical protein
MADIRITLQYTRNGADQFATAHWPVEDGETVEEAIEGLTAEYEPKDGETWYKFEAPGTNGYDSKTTMVRTSDITEIGFKPVSSRG